MKYLLILLLAAAAASVHATTFAWDNDPDPTVTGYNFYLGTAAGQEALLANAGTALTFSQTFSPGVYFAVVKAYNAAGKVSLPSNEVTFTIAAPTPTPTPAAPTNLHVTVP